MPKAKFYMAYIQPRKDVEYETIEEKMNLANDWFRVSDELWILYTTSDADKWHSRLKPFVDPDGYLFVSKLDVTQRQGWMKKSFWKWLRRED